MSRFALRKSRISCWGKRKGCSSIAMATVITLDSEDITRSRAAGYNNLAVAGHDDLAVAGHDNLAVARGHKDYLFYEP